MVELETTATGLVEALEAVPWLAERVVRGWRDSPLGRVPLAALSAPQVQSDEGPVMGQWQRRTTYLVQAWHRLEPAVPGKAAVGIESAMNALITALEKARLSPESSLYKLPEFRVADSNAYGNETREPVRVRPSTAPTGSADVEVPSGTVLVVLQLSMLFRRRTGLSGKDST